MKHFATLAAFAASANALVGRAGNCCFQITASGGASGPLGQLDDGQNRIGDNSLSPATYCIDSSGGITDDSGRGCILTPPTTQLQCDEGASPTPGFSINSQGQIEYNGSTHFVACETGQNGGLNVYTSPNSGDVTGCRDVTLTASSCSNSGAGGGAPGGGAGTSAVPGATPSPSVPGGGVPGGGAGTSGVPGASPSASVPGGGVPGGGAGTSGVPGASPSASVPGGGVPGGGAGTSGVPGATPSGSAPGGGAGTPGVPGAGGGVIKTTIRTTQTVAVCPETSTPGVPGGGAGTPGVPGGGAGTSGVPGGGAGTPGVPGATPTGSVPGGGAGTPGVPGATPTGSVPGGGAGTPGVPGATPTGSVPGGGAGTPGAPGTTHTGGAPGGGAGTSPSGAPTGPGAGTGPSASPSGPGGGAGAGPSGTPTTPGGGASCPTDLSGDYEFPHLIIPIDSSSPDHAPGTSLNGTITDTISSIFNFDIPSSDAGKTCSLIFLFPHLQDLETSSFSFSGDGKIDFALLDGVANGDTSFNNAPDVKKDLGEFTVSPGNSYLISTFKCPAGQAVSYEMKNAGTTSLDFFEDYNPSPLGLYITVC